MHTQIKTIQSVGIRVPESLNNNSFIFGEVFSLGERGDTNLSSRNRDFDDSFFTRSKKRCRMPGEICFKDVPSGMVDTLLGISGAQTDEKLWDCRIPIKLVGYLKDQQKMGDEPGPLLVDGNLNIFICRDQHDQLKKVQLLFDQESRSWKIFSFKMEPRQVLEGPCRLFVACREE